LIAGIVAGGSSDVCALVITTNFSFVTGGEILDIREIWEFLCEAVSMPILWSISCICRRIAIEPLIMH
jgi:hypothetical protein